MKIVAAAITLSTLIYGQAALSQDVDAGKKVFKKCQACHKIGEGAKNSTGPVLTNVIGRTAGTYEGYKYSKTLKAAKEAGLVWDTDNLASYIENPKNYMKALLNNKKAKPKMSFKLKDAQKRADVVAYVASFSQPMEAEIPATQTVAKSDVMAPAGGVCVHNASRSAYFFVAEGENGVRVTKQLEPNEVLCTPEIPNGTKGSVSVFETEDHFEGCTRLVKANTVEQMMRYSEFDRCLWTSNAG